MIHPSAAAIQLHQITLKLADKTILQNASYGFPQNKISVLLGASGSGKSTLLRIVAGLLTPDQGQVSGIEKPLAFVFQEPRLLPWLNVGENIMLPLTLAKTRHPNFNSNDLSHILQQVGLSSTQKLYPHQLSGGMKMRVSIARALLSKPRTLLMDEPFSALDEVTRCNLQELLIQLQKELQMTIVFVTHSFSEAVFLADHIYLLQAQGGQPLADKEIIFPQRNFALRTAPEYTAEVQSWGQQLRKSLEMDKKT